MGGGSSLFGNFSQIFPFFFMTAPLMTFAPLVSITFMDKPFAQANHYVQKWLWFYFTWELDSKTKKLKKTGAELRKAQARLPIQFVLLVNSDLCKCEKRSSLSKVDKVKFKFKESSASSSSEIFWVK